MGRKIAIMGAGAVGAYCGAHMVREGEDVTFIDAWPEHVEKMRQGLHITGTTPEEEFTVPVRALHLNEVQQLSKEAPIDIAFVCPKSYDTAWSTMMIAQYLAPGGFVVSLQNCMNEETIAGVVGWGKTLGCIASQISVELYEPAHVHRGVKKGGAAHTVFRVGEVHGRITDRVVRARGPREAETVKLLETNYRHVNIALVNEMAVFCHDTGVDLWDVIRCAETKPFGYQPFRPGPGVGGHGVPIDPNYLAYRGRSLGYPLRMVELAKEVNDRMPRYVIQRCALLLNEHGKAARGARVLLLGVTYKPDIGDQAGSPAREIAARLLEMGAQLSYHDPYVPQWQVLDRPVPRADSLYEATAGADLTVLLQHHRTYDLQGLAVKAQLLLDTRGASPAGTAHRL